MFEHLKILKKMWLLKTMLLGVVCLLCSPSAMAQNSNSMFMRLDMIPGESTDSTYTNWVDIKEFREGVSKSGSAFITAADRLEVVKNLDKSSPFLRQHAVTSQSIAAVDIVVRNNGSNIKIFSVKLMNVKVESVNTVFPQTGTMPEETVLLKFGGVTWTYIPTNPNGTAGSPISVTYNFPSNLLDDAVQKTPNLRKK